MNRIDFQEAKDSFDYEEFCKGRKSLYNKRNKFVKHFSIRRLESMGIDEYVQGKGDTESFCYHLEWGLMDLGRIVGSTCIKFGIYFSSDKDDYIFANKFGDTADEAYVNVIDCIIKLIEDGKCENYNELATNPISPMVKGKILAMYYPEKYLNVFSGEHLNYFLKALGLDTTELIKSDEIYKRKALVDFKKKDKDMKFWSNDAFAYFLYNYYPKPPRKGSSTNATNKFDFPTPKKIYIIDDIEVFSSGGRNKPISKPGKNDPDYEAEAREAKRLGDRGEDIVMQYEIKRIKELFRTKKYPKHVSLESDRYGYDILSLNEDGSERYIEVKATKSQKGNFSFFYTANELRAAEEYGKDYYLYVVFEVDTYTPKIWPMQNPFIGKNKLNLIPIKYNVIVKTKQQ